MLIRMVDENKVSTDKKPSAELISLIKAAANDLLSFGELWQSIKKKGNDEGFSEKELQDMLRPFLKEKLDSKKVWYLFHAEEQKDRSKQQYQNRTNISTNAAKKEPEQTYNPEEEIKKIGEIRRAEQKRQAEQPIIPDDEDPKDLEIAFLKEKVIELEEALKKTQLFVPATQLPQTVNLQLNDPQGLIQEAVMTDEACFKYLRDRAKETGNIIVIDRVGSGALAQSLYQYKGLFGVAELFLRVIP